MSGATVDAAERYVGAAVVLAAAAALPFALLIHPPRQPAAWPLLTVALVAVAASRGARSRRAPPAGADRSPRAGGRVLEVALWPAVAVAADAAWRAFLRLLAPERVDILLFDTSTMMLAALVGAASAWARRLADRTELVGGPTVRPDEVVPRVGPALLTAACLALATAGLAHAGAITGWERAGAAAGVTIYAAVSVLHLQRLHRVALEASWRRSGRDVPATIVRDWPAKVLFVLGVPLVATVPWWLPVARPLRAAVERTPRAVLDWLGARATSDVRPGRPEGERFQWLGDESVRTVGNVPIPDVVTTVVAAVVLLAVVAFLVATVRRPAPRRGTPGGGAAGWLRSFLRSAGRSGRAVLALVAAMLRRRIQEAPPHSQAAAAHPGQRSRLARALDWRRPSNPREQVKHDYRRVLEAAAARGLGRQRWQSPHDYAAALRVHVVGHEGALTLLTDRFVEARYSRHAVDVAAAQGTKEAARELREALRAADR